MTTMIYIKALELPQTWCGYIVHSTMWVNKFMHHVHYLWMPEGAAVSVGRTVLCSERLFKTVNMAISSLYSRNVICLTKHTQLCNGLSGFLKAMLLLCHLRQFWNVNNHRRYKTFILGSDSHSALSVELEERLLLWLRPNSSRKQRA